MTSLVLTLTETLRYRGAIGQWSWVLHRLTGLGVLFFLVLHVIDTSWAVFYPDLYEHAIKTYQSPLFTLGEFGLVFAVVYHAFNGVRIAIFDYKPQWWKHQQRAAIWVVVLTVVVLVPTFIGMIGHVIDYYNGSPYILPLDEVLLGQLPFAVGIGAAALAALVLSLLYGVIAGNREQKFSAGVPRVGEKFWWSFMRISGLLIVPLVFGHLAFNHVIQGVFDLTARDYPVVGTVDNDPATVADGINQSGTATEFVYERWAFAIGSVYVWRIYDVALLALVTLHGFNGFRYVSTDYAGNRTIRRAFVILCVIGAVVLIVVGGAALIRGVDEQAIELALEASARYQPE